MDCDRELCRRLADGESAAYERAWDLYGPGLYRAALRILASDADAQDAVQNVFVALVRGRVARVARVGSRVARVESRVGLSKVRDLKAYLYASLRNAACDISRDLARRRKRSAEFYADSQTDSRAVLENTTGGDDADNAADIEKLWQMVARLPLEQREVVVLKIQGGLTFEQVAQACGIAPTTAAGRYRYALEKLRRMKGKFKD